MKLVCFCRKHHWSSACFALQQQQTGTIRSDSYLLEKHGSEFPAKSAQSQNKVTSHRWAGRRGGWRSCRLWRWWRWRSEKLETVFVPLSQISCRCLPADEEQGRKNTEWAPPIGCSVHYIQRGPQANRPSLSRPIRILLWLVTRGNHVRCSVIGPSVTLIGKTQKGILINIAFNWTINH